MKQNEFYLPPEYPFGFGFALMQNPRAIAHLSEMSEPEWREFGRKISAISSEEEWRNLISELALIPPKF
ncbi:MAG: hypothetical protein J6Q82_04865 [Clostridia bacterium]|nr:hypothetical protein [Clostridia bacterium]